MRIILSTMAFSLAVAGFIQGAIAFERRHEHFSIETAPVATVLYSLLDAANPDNATISSGLVTDEDGTLYGAVSYNYSGFNQIIKLTPPTSGQSQWATTVIYQFASYSEGSGIIPTLLRGHDGALYGTTQFGGSYNNGTVFKLTPPQQSETAWTKSVVYEFSGPDGYSPMAQLIAGHDGALYGTTAWGGNSFDLSTFNFGKGTVFKLTPPGNGQTVWTQTLLYSFTGGNDGAIPQASLIMDWRGRLYGTTSLGGSSGNYGQGFGAVFELTPPLRGDTAWTENTLYAFTGGSDGSQPMAGLALDRQGALYGTTAYGGVLGVNSLGYGTVFKLSPPRGSDTSWVERVLYAFTGLNGDGLYPQAALLRDDRGVLYGTTAYGGSASDGTIFKLSPPEFGQTAWTETILYNVTGGTDGVNPKAGLIPSETGAVSLFGTTFGGYYIDDLGAAISEASAVFELKLCSLTTHPAYNDKPCPSFKGDRD